MKKFVWSADYHEGMIDPDLLDIQGQSFSYFSNPTDIIGIPDAVTAFEITPEGYVWNGVYELMFFTGNPPTAVNQRIRRLEDGYLPIIRYNVDEPGKNLRWHFMMFAAEAATGGKWGNVPAALIKVSVCNTSDTEERTAFFSSAYRFRAPSLNARGKIDYRFLPNYKRLPDSWRSRLEKSKDFDPDWEYSFETGAFLRNGEIIYCYPEEPQPYMKRPSIRESQLLRIHRYLSGEVEGDELNLTRHKPEPNVPMGLLQYALFLEPGAEEELVFTMPPFPIDGGSCEERKLLDHSFKKELEKTKKMWKGMLSSLPFSFPEEKVQNFLSANIIYNILSIDKIGDDRIMCVNKYQYHSYNPQNSSSMSISLDFVGMHDAAEQTLLYAKKEQRPDGNFTREKGETREPSEGWGYVLWAWTRHYELTANREFLLSIYPHLKKAVEWLEETLKDDPEGLLPPCTIPDDAFLTDIRQTGEHMWILIGLRCAMRLSQAMGDKAEHGRITALYSAFRGSFDRLLEEQVKKTKGYIPPALTKTTEGNDWDNLLTLYPEQLFDPFDYRVSATIKETRSKYQEGILTYIMPPAFGFKDGAVVFDKRRRLHYWHTQDNALNALVRGGEEDQKNAVKDLYAVLLHTSSTHATQEFGTLPWSTRDFSHPGNIMPDGAVSAKTIELLRHMLIREDGTSLYLFSAVSPEWLQEGKVICITKAPSNFGPVTAAMQLSKTGLFVTINDGFRTSPQQIIITIPWFFRCKKAQVDGSEYPVIDGMLRFAPPAGEIKITGTIIEEERISYKDTVAAFNREYKNRYNHFLRTGK